MNEQKELCPKCGSAAFGILRDMTSRRVCKCGNTWDAPKLDKTTHKLPDNRQAMARPNLIEIKARCEAATEGPWVTTCADEYPMLYNDLYKGCFGIEDDNRNISKGISICYPEGRMNKSDAKFIAHARQDIPDLLKYVEELEGKLKFYREYADCNEGCRSRSDSWVLKCNCGFVAKEKEHRQALSKIKALGIVKEGE